MSENQSASLLRRQLAQAGDWYQGTMQGVDAEMAHYQPGGQALPIAGVAGHALAALDMIIIGGIGGKQPLIMSSHAGNSGLSEPPPQGDWAEWARTVRVDPDALAGYASAVFAGVDDVLSSVSDADLEGKIDLGLGEPQSKESACSIMLLNLYSHTGEISCIKGLQGHKGYPF